MHVQKYNRRRKRVRQSERKYFAHVKVCHMTEEESDGESNLIMRPISWRSDGNLTFDHHYHNMQAPVNINRVQSLLKGTG